MNKYGYFKPIDYSYFKEMHDTAKYNEYIICLDKINLLNDRISKAIEYIEYYFAKGRTKNHKQFDLSLYEILTGKNLFNLTMEEIEQFFKGVDKE